MKAETYYLIAGIIVALATTTIVATYTAPPVFAQSRGNPHDLGESGNPHDLTCSGNPHDLGGPHEPIDTCPGTK